MRFLTSLVLALVFLGSAHASVTEATLDNGMRVLVKRDARAPIAVSMVWYRIGGSYEEPGSTGLSHVLEHMMFRGTKNTEPGEFSRTISALGGSENAFTSRDYTAYFETLAVEHLDKALELEADRMRNMTLNNDEFLRELEVVKEERRLRTDDKPTGLLYEQLMSTAYRASSYQNPVIGWMNDLDQMKVEDLKRWYDMWYQPNNATLVVVGDVEGADVVAMAKKHFGSIPRGDVPQLRETPEPPQRGLTRVNVSVSAKQPYLLMGYKVPVIGSGAEEWEPYALAVLSSILDGGDSARLTSEMVREQKLAASAGASYDAYSRLPSLFLMDGVPNEGVNLDQIEQALLEQVKRLHDAPISSDELKRVVTQAVAQKVFAADSFMSQAMELGSLDSIGLDWRLVSVEIENLKKVTAEQVQAVAKKYLVERNLTIARLDPVQTGAQQ